MIDGKNGLCASIQLVILFFLTYYIIKQSYIDYGEIINNEKLILIVLFFF